MWLVNSLKPVLPSSARNWLCGPRHSGQRSGAPSSYWVWPQTVHRHRQGRGRANSSPSSSRPAHRANRSPWVSSTWATRSNCRPWTRSCSAVRTNSSSTTASPSWWAAPAASIYRLRARFFSASPRARFSRVRLGTSIPNASFFAPLFHLVLPARTKLHALFEILLDFNNFFTEYPACPCLSPGERV